MGRSAYYDSFPAHCSTCADKHISLAKKRDAVYWFPRDGDAGLPIEACLLRVKARQYNRLNIVANRIFQNRVEVDVAVPVVKRSLGWRPKNPDDSPWIEVKLL